MTEKPEQGVAPCKPIENPIVDDHIQFARAIIAVAREHGANRIDMTFNLSGSRRFFEHTSNWQQVRLFWCEGRHGAEARFTLTADVKAEVSERGNNTPHAPEKE